MKTGIGAVLLPRPLQLLLLCRQDGEGPRQPMGTVLVRQRVCGQAASACSQRGATAPPVPTGVPESLVLLPGWAGAVCRMAGMHSAGALLPCNDF